jgi:formate dehydrogenase
MHLAPAGISVRELIDEHCGGMLPGHELYGYLPARNLMRFFRDESCGQCTPCRVGTAKALALMDEKRWNQPLLGELSQAMMDASICGLGQAAPNPVQCVIKYFPHEVA